MIDLTVAQTNSVYTDRHPYTTSINCILVEMMMDGVSCLFL